MTMTLQYRMAKVTTSASVAGGTTSMGSWTKVSGADIALDEPSAYGIIYKTINVGSDPGLAFQLRVTADDWLEIVGLVMHLEVQPQRQQ